MKRLSLCNSPQDFVQTRGLISLVNDNHVYNNIKEILVYAYLGSTVNNPSRKHAYITLIPLNPTFI